MMYNFKCEWLNWDEKQNITRKKLFFAFIPLKNKGRKMKKYNMGAFGGTGRSPPEFFDFRSVFDDLSKNICQVWAQNHLQTGIKNSE